MYEMSPRCTSLMSGYVDPLREHGNKVRRGATEGTFRAPVLSSVGCSFWHVVQSPSLSTTYTGEVNKPDDTLGAFLTHSARAFVLSYRMCELIITCGR